MPTLISETDVSLERDDLLRRVQLPRDLDSSGRWIVPPARTPGLHLSGLLRYVAMKSKVTAWAQDANEEEEIERGKLPIRWALGQAVEEFWASLYPDMKWQPGELTDPVIMTPDGLSFENGEWIIEECKTRRYKRFESGPKMLNSKWAWAQQGMAEAIGYGTPYVRWSVWSLFEFPDPKLTRYLFKFDDAELEGCRRMIEVNQEAAIRAGFAE